MSTDREMLFDENGIAGVAMALPATDKAIANNSMDLLHISACQILGSKRLEVLDRLRAGLTIEVMRYPVAERAAINKCSLQPEMQAHLSCEVDSALPNLRLIRFTGTGESFTRHHAKFADARHELLIGVAPLLGLTCGKG